MKEVIAVIGLGYVGLPVALAMANSFEKTIGFDINQNKIESLKNGIDHTDEIEPEILRSSTLKLTSNPDELRSATFFVVAVPTPVDRYHRPDLSPLVSASELVARSISRGAVVVFESTVYPGVTEEVCGPVIERISGLKQGVDFKLGYSPERINPGDKEHTFERIVKVVSGEDDATLERVASVYERVVPAGVHRAASIKVAEAAKVIENTQRDLNIALMNELALIFDRLGIRTQDVLAAANTKWNFLPFKPGLVGGHCIGVDPYYLTTKAEEIGYHPQVILAGRRINDGMGSYVANRFVKMLIDTGKPIRGARVAILGLTFKENVPDIRNSRVPDIINELKQFGIKPLVYDPLVTSMGAEEEYGVSLCHWDDLNDLDGLILAVAHSNYIDKVNLGFDKMLKIDGVIVDVKSVVDRHKLPASIHYWSL